MTPRFAQGKRVRYVVWEYEHLIDSSEIEPADWIRIASDIERNYAAWDGFLILHGTDTLAFTASALSFLLVRPSALLGVARALADVLCSRTRRKISGAL